MANPSTPFGYLDNGLMDGSAPTFGMYTGTISASNTNKIYGGDVAKPQSGGYFDVFTAAVGGGEPIGGIFLPHFSWLSISAGQRIFSRAWLGQTGDISGGTVSCKVLIARDNILRVRSSGASGSAVPATAVGESANFSIGTAPGNNLISAFQLDDSTLGTGPSLPFTVYSIDQQPVSDPTSIYNTVLVRMNNLVLP
jgi:hypothetical protein